MSKRIKKMQHGAPFLWDRISAASFRRGRQSPFYTIHLQTSNYVTHLASGGKTGPCSEPLALEVFFWLHYSSWVKESMSQGHVPTSTLHWPSSKSRLHSSQGPQNFLSNWSEPLLGPGWALAWVGPPKGRPVVLLWLRAGRAALCVCQGVGKKMELKNAGLESSHVWLAPQRNPQPSS